MLRHFVPVPFRLHEAGFVGKGVHILDGKDDARETPAQHLDQPPRHFGGDRLDLDHLHGVHVDDHGAVGANPERSQAGAFGHVPGDTGRPAGNRDDVDPGPLRRLDGVDGALAHGAVGAQESAVEVGGYEPHREPRRQGASLSASTTATEATQ